MMDDDTKAFLEEIEKRHGGKTTYRTYATWFCSNNGLSRDYGVFLYRIGDTFFFEDFERTPTFFGIVQRPKKNKEPFIKYEDSFNKADIKRIDKVLRSKAEKNFGARLFPPIPPANGLQGALCKTLTQVVLNDGRIFYFELISEKEFLKALTH